MTLKIACKKALAMDRTSLLIRKKQQVQAKHNNNNQIRLIGDFSKEHKETLEQDRDLKQIIGDRSFITFRRSMNLRDRVTLHPHQVHVAARRNKGLQALVADIKEFNPAYFMNCKTTGSEYIMRCGCDKVYVGKTRREFRRILEHEGDVRNKRNTSVANHINELHDEHFKPTTRIGDIDNKLLQCEAKWIYWLNSRLCNGKFCANAIQKQKDIPNGLNEGFTFKPFL
ncbi:hypothetical protein XELAEV_18028142mg [Xenopus laevis]|uniref:GIY-YIG domain-containing protein n=1 Tax=Xenopus laevis TaxID=8355 RepID=A0A974CWK6_XENLA|nr:hypothetical protein XELAEV_18028142mg [Xenopus laevis]